MMLAFYPTTSNQFSQCSRRWGRCAPAQVQVPAPSRYDSYLKELAEEEAKHTAYAAALARERARVQQEVARAQAIEAARRARLEQEVARARAIQVARQAQLESLRTGYVNPFSFAFEPTSHSTPSNDFSFNDLEALLKMREARRERFEAQRQQELQQQEIRRKQALEAQEREKKAREERERQQQQFREQLERLMMIDFGDIWSHPENRDPLNRSNAMRKPTQEGPAPMASSSGTQEKTSTQPAPPASPASSYDSRFTALTVLDSLSTEFDSLTSAFTFPSSLEFEVVSPGSTPLATHRLTYSAANSGFHSHEEVLMRLLQKLDGVESGGDDSVREVRRNLVHKVEKALEALETQKEELWSGSEAGQEEAQRKGKEVDRTVYPGLKKDEVEVPQASQAPAVKHVTFEEPLEQDLYPTSPVTFEEPTQFANEVDEAEPKPYSVSFPTFESDHANVINLETSISSAPTPAVDDVVVESHAPVPVEDAIATLSFPVEVPVIAASNEVDTVAAYNTIVEDVVPTQSAVSPAPEDASGYEPPLDVAPTPKSENIISFPPTVLDIDTEVHSDSDLSILDSEEELVIDLDLDARSDHDETPTQSILYRQRASSLVTPLTTTVEDDTETDLDLDVESVDEEDAANFVVID